MVRLYLLVGLVFFMSCKTVDRPRSALNNSQLPSNFVTVQPGKDTVIRTAGGAIITIQDGTFTKPVKLEIKEAYSMADILLGGLVTESDGRL